MGAPRAVPQLSLFFVGYGLMKPTLVIDAGTCNTAILFARPDQDIRQWARSVFPAGNPVLDAGLFLEQNGLPQPETTLICSMGEHPVPSAYDSARILRWQKELRHVSGRPEENLRQDLSEWEVQPLLEEVIQTFGNGFAADSAAAAVMAVLSIPSLRDRSWQEGVTVVYAGHSHVQVFMVYQDKVWGLYEHHADIPLPLFQEHLKEMRLNWLPDEQVKRSGGHGCICGELPAEAEGFRPTYVLGPARERFAACGRLVSSCGDARFDRCFGLLEALQWKEKA